MKRLAVYSHLSDTDAVVRRLMRCRCVEISRSEPDAETVRYDCEAARAELETRVRRITESLTTLHKYSKKTRSMIEPRHSVNTAEFMANEYERALETVERTLSVKAEISECRTRQSELLNRINELRPWMRLDLPLSYEGTDSTRVILGRVPTDAEDKGLRDAVEEADGCLEIISRSDAFTYICVICTKDDTAGMLSSLSPLGFSRMTFKDGGKTAAKTAANCERELLSLEKREEELYSVIYELADSVYSVEILLDVEASALRAAENKQKLVADGTVSLLEGWVPERCEARVKSVLEKFDCAYELRDPLEDETAPILLKNNAYAVNFEWVVGMYAYPKYGRFDPTFIMSIFYFFIFGIMFADVGYGLLTVIGCFGGIFLLKPKPSMKRFLSMFGYCGFSSILFGAIFGGWFGDMPFAIMTNMLGMADAKQIFPFFNGLWFNPMDDPIMFLVVSLAVGVIHIVAGMAVKFYILCKDGQWVDAVCDILSWWLLFGGIGLFFLNSTVGLIVAGAGVLMILLTAGRAKKGIFGKLIGGLLGLYDVVNYLSDILSYSRILALGLASAVIAQVVNLIGTMGSGAVGYIIMVLVFILGHALNLAINLLGTFVHTSRLQYLEFFGKFYEDGGEPFKAAEPSEVYSVADGDEI